MKTWKPSERSLPASPLARHSLLAAAIFILVGALYLGLYSRPSGALLIDDGVFSFDSSEWVSLEDVNLSSNRAIMSRKTGARALASFDIPLEGEYTLWLKYYGNYGPSDQALWKRAYTNELGYIDYFGSLEPSLMTVIVDSSPPVTFTQKGSHRYRWARIGTYSLTAGNHTLAVSKAVDGPGPVTMDHVIATSDPLYDPGRYEALPRQVSEYLGPALIAVLPIFVWLFVRDGRSMDYSVYLLYSIILSVVMSVLWIDTDGGFWIWLSQKADFTLSTIYTDGHSDALHHRYVYPPPIAVLLVMLRPLYELIGAMDGISVKVLIASKLIVLPFVAAIGVVLCRLEGQRAAALWLLNSLVIFTVAANSLYFGLGLILTLLVWAVRDERHYLSAALFGAGMAYLSVTTLLLPPFLLLLRRLPLKKAVVMALLAVLPAVIVLLPYRLIDPAGVNLRVMGAGIATWMSMHLGMRIGDVGMTSLMYGALLAYLWVKKPAFDYISVTAVFALTVLLYLNIGAPYFLAWAVAFQPLIIIWACRLGKETFYSLYVTALMVWGSFFVNTGGANDRAGETGFFPFYVFYTWPFDAYALLRTFYNKVDFFSQYELEAMAHSISAGISLVLFALILVSFGRYGEDAGNE